MSTETNEGGQAFPSGNPTHGGDIGMTLRDYFAAKAVVGLLATHIKNEQDEQVPWLFSDLLPTWNHNHGRETLACLAYELADAMLLAREITKTSSPSQGAV